MIPLLEILNVGSIGFDMMLNFALALRLRKARTKDKLMLLNTIRNKCSQYGLLKAPVRRGKRPKQKKPPLLLYGGRDLYNVAVLKEFANDYDDIYFKPFLRYLDL
jgi:hypothetical protein